MKKLVVAVIGLMGLGVGANAAAVHEYAIKYTEQELSSLQGIANVHKRIMRTARRYCPTYTQIRDQREVRACIADVVNDLIRKVDHPRLTSYHLNDKNMNVATAASVGEPRS